MKTPRSMDQIRSKTRPIIGAIVLMPSYLETCTFKKKSKDYKSKKVLLFRNLTLQVSLNIPLFQLFHITLVTVEVK